MFYLVLAIIASMLISIVMRLSENYSRDNLPKLAVNYVMCCVLSLVFSGTTEFLPAHEGLPMTLLLGVICGILYLVNFLLLQWNIQRNGVVLSSTFMKLGVLVPTLFSITVFGETPKAVQIVGFILALAAIILMQGGGSAKGASTSGLLILLVLGGSADCMSKIYEEIGSPALQNQFLLYTFATALLLCAALCLYKKQKLTLQDCLWGLGIGIPNYFSARFLLLSLKSVPAVIVFPSFSVGTIVLVALVGMLCFKERLTRRKWIALGIILGALILLNL